MPGEDGPPEQGYRVGAPRQAPWQEPSADPTRVVHPALSAPARPLIPALDGFRAIAILIVMGSHVGLSQFVPGQFGVTLFFFLSGYLITTLLRREYDRHGTIDLRAFYLRRAVRILPPLYFALALAMAASAAGLIPPIYHPGLLADLAFLSNYLPLSHVPMGLWSLSVEEHYYVVFPALMLILLHWRGASACAAACVFLSLVTLALRLWEVDRLQEISQVNFWTHTRIDSILFGAILACWNNPVIDRVDRLPSRWWSYAIGGTMLLLTFAVRDEAFRQTFRYSIQGAALLLVFNAAIRDPVFARRLLDARPMRVIALLSYSLYLVHTILVEAAKPLVLQIGAPLALGGALALSFFISYGVHLILERPLAEWRRSVEKRLRKGRPAARPAVADPRSEATAERATRT